MKNYYRKMKAITLVVFVFGLNTAQDQALTSSDIIEAWDVMTKMVVESAKLMSSENYQFSPGDPLRSFADQINHTTRSNFGFASSVNAGKPGFKVPGRNNLPQEKEEVVDLLEKSFAHFRGGLAKLSQADLEEMVKWGHPSNPKQITRLKAILIVMSHLQREHGKTMMYLRAKGIKPASSGSWKF